MIARSLSLVLLIWCVALCAAPLVGRVQPAQHPRPTSLQWTATAAAALVYAVGSRVCHQRTERSFHLAGAQLPVCARCTALYLAGLLGCALALWQVAGPCDAAGARARLACAAVPSLLTLVVEWSGVADPGNLTRAVAALPLGAALAWLSAAALRAPTATARATFDTL